MTLGTVQALGGLGQSNHEQTSGGGGNGRIRVEYCDSISGSTNPSASSQKLDCNYYLFLPLVIKNACSAGWETEPNNSYLQANGPLLSGQTICGYPNDNKDYFSFTSGSSGPISITLNNHTGSGVQLQLFYGPPGSPVVYVYAPPYQINYTGAAGTYYVYIYTASGYNSNDPGYNLTVTHP